MLLQVAQKENCQTIYRINQDASLQKQEIKASLPIFHYMSTILTSNQESIIFSGGIKDNSQIQSLCYEFNFLNQKLKAFPPLKIARFAHCSIIFNGKLIVFGGREYGPDQVSLLNSVEIFNESSGQWEKGPTMIKKRCSFNCFIYKQKLFALGGYSYVGKRTRTIEYFKLSSNCWKRYKHRLPKGIESASIFSFSKNKLILAGGYTNAGASNGVWLFNMENGSSQFIGNMNYSRVLQKGFLLGENEFVVYGGDTGNTVEKGFIDPSSLIPKFQMESQMTIDAFDFCEAKLSLNVESSNENFEEEVKFDTKDFYLFGNDAEPLVIQIDLKGNCFQLRPLPKNLELYAYQATVRISEHEIFFCGGITKGMDRITKSSFLLDLKTGKVNILPKMIYPRYAHNAIFYKGKVFVVGGRYSQASDSAILETCECFSFETRKWKTFHSLSAPKCSVALVIANENLYALGGYIGEGKRTSEIEVFDFKSNWKKLSVKLPLEIEAGSALCKGSKIVYFAGLSNEGFCGKIQTLDLQNGLSEVSTENFSGRFLFKFCQKGERVYLMGGASPSENVKSCVLSFNDEGNQMQVEPFGIILLETLLSLGAECEMKSFSFA